MILSQLFRARNTASLMKHGIGGTVSDLLQNLHTCLRVQRISRAEAIIAKILEETGSHSPEACHAHGVYLEERLRMLKALPTKAEKVQTFDQMQGWFDLEILDKNVQPDARAYVSMIRATLESLSGPKRDRAVNRYLDMAENSGEEIYDEVLYSTEYDDEEFTTLGQISSEFYTSEEEKANMATQESAAEETSPLLRESDIPQILATDQRGLGLETLKQTLSSIEEKHKEVEVDLDSETRKQLNIERQRLIEELSGEAATRRWKLEDEQLRRVGIDSALQSRPLGALMWEWYSALLPALREELREVRNSLENPLQYGKLDDRTIYGAHMESIQLETIAATTIIFVLTSLSRGKSWDDNKYHAPDLKISNLTALLGKALQDEANAEVVRKTTLAESRKSKSPFRAFARRARLPVKKRRNSVDIAANELDWPSLVRVKLSAMLLSRLMDTAKIPVSRVAARTQETVTALQPAFFHKFKYENGKRQGYLVPNEALLEKIFREPVGGLIAKKLPMVTEPLPWTGFAKGGYYNYSNNFIRYPPSDSTPRDYALAATARGDMEQVFAAINVLSKLPWVINEDVFKVQVEAWNSGEEIANFAPLHPKSELPPEPDSADTDARRRWLGDVQDAENVRKGLHSKRCFQNFQMEVARAFYKETLYFPHNIDFRGRAYPIPPYLNHMGADNARGLMKFAQGKELGVQGLRWLKIHLANVFGYDKASLKEREEFADEHIADIYDSATNPLNGNRWWLQSEDAWQTLATCIELKKALDSPDPTKFVSQLPVHQDGTCNGLQHYAALGGDPIGARQVNLEPSDRPSDVYSAVSDAVKAEVDKDVEAGNPIAKILQGNITRKVVKQPVMTNVYGVTYYGAKEQVQTQLEDIFPDVRRSDPINHSVMAAYIAQKIFKSLGEMFTGAQAIQRWLGECADRISTCVTPEQIEELQRTVAGYRRKEDGRGRRARNEKKVEAKPLFKSSVIWTTPLRLPVVQPYRSPKRATVKTNLQGIALMEPQAWDPVSKRKQLQGFPPNFIHSLDSTHMMLSALRCDETGMAFASIHDSFWTHACDVDRLSVILRDAFVDMHSEDIVGRLRQEFVARHKESMYLASVNRNTPVGRKIAERQATLRKKDSPRRQKPSSSPVTLSPQLQDLLMEVERIELLESEDPEEQERGRNMVTPGSIFAAEATGNDLAVPKEITDAQLGEIPEDPNAAALEDANAKGLVDPVLEDDVEMQDEEVDVEYSDVEETNTEADDGDVVASDAVDDDNEFAAKGDYADPMEIASPKKKIKKHQAIKKVFVWLPIEFPPVPEKGSFDVKRLKESKYFFS